MRAGCCARHLATTAATTTESYNTKLLAEAAATMPAGAKLAAWGGLASIPPFSEDDENDPGPAVRALRAASAEAGAGCRWRVEAAADYRFDLSARCLSVIWPCINPRCRHGPVCSR